MPVEGQNPQLRKLADDLAKAETGMTQTEAWEKGVCVECKQPALPRCHTAAGRSEYNISAMCEECFDRIFADEDE
jgi:hypothetical protein